MRASALRLRVVATMTAVALIASALTLIGLVAPMASVAMNRAVGLFDGLPEVVLDQCEVDPVRWEHGNERGLRVFAFDRSSGAALNPDAPAPPSNLSVRLAAGEREPLALTSGHYAAMMVLDTGRSGPCGAVLLMWPETDRTRETMVQLSAVVVLGIGLMALMAGWWTTIRPMLASVQSLDRASRLVGTPEYATASGEVDRSLEQVAAAMDDAHRRVQAEREQLLAHQRAMEEHLSDVAHDLKTPIAALQLRLDELAGRHDPDAIRGALQDVVYLGLLTDNLGAAGKLRLDSWRPDAVPCDLAELVRRVVERIAALGKRQGVTVEYAVPEDPVVASVAVVAAEQVLANLVHNAVVHNRTGGRVAVVLERREPGFAIEVVDDGPGIPEAERARAQERGVRLGGSDSGHGAGLGLAIAFGLSERIGWVLSLENAEPTGLMARLTGPVSAVPPQVLNTPE